MTRINLVRPLELCDQMLLAELQEIKRVFPLADVFAQKHAFLSAQDLIPKRYTMGRGHVKFFYNRYPFLVSRHRMLVNEALIRGFKVQRGLPATCLESAHFRRLSQEFREAKQNDRASFSGFEASLSFFSYPDGSFVVAPEAEMLNRQRIGQRLREMKREPKWTVKGHPK